MNFNMKFLMDISPVAAAVFGGVSALVAARALIITSQSAKEAQEMNARQGFEQRYTLLLTQHNTLHDALCEHLKVELKVKNVNGIEVKLSNYNDSVGGMDKYFYFLTGHPVISPYMRVLYHLLKHIDADPFIANKSDAEKKRYSSPLRSYIKNDVLFLIAVNALNVKDERLKETGYPEYQKLLHRFNFFEHAVFSNPRQPNEPFKETLVNLKRSDTPGVNVNDTIAVEEYHVLDKIRNRLNWVSYLFETAAKLAKLPEPETMKTSDIVNGASIMLTPAQSLDTPFLASIIVYSTPHSGAIKTARDRFIAEILGRCKSAYEEGQLEMTQSQYVKKFIGGFYYDDAGLLCTVNALGDLKNLATGLSDLVVRHIKVFSAGTTSPQSISLSTILKDIDMFEKYERVKWPQDKEDFYKELDRRIYSVLRGAMNSFRNSYQHKYKEHKVSPKRTWSKW